MVVHNRINNYPINYELSKKVITPGERFDYLCLLNSHAYLLLLFLFPLSFQSILGESAGYTFIFFF